MIRSRARITREIFNQRGTTSTFKSPQPFSPAISAMPVGMSGRTRRTTTVSITSWQHCRTSVDLSGPSAYGGARGVRPGRQAEIRPERKPGVCQLHSPFPTLRVATINSRTCSRSASISSQRVGIPARAAMAVRNRCLCTDGLFYRLTELGRMGRGQTDTGRHLPGAVRVRPRHQLRYADQADSRSRDRSCRWSPGFRPD